MADAPTILGPEDMAKLGRYRFAVRLMVEGWLSGRHRAKGRGSGSDFLEYRAYAPGDDPRLVDWRVFARTDRLQLRTFENETHAECHLMVDSSASMGFRGLGPVSKLAFASHFAACLAWLVVRGADRVSLHLFDEQVRFSLPPGSTAAHLNECLRRLEGNRPGGKTDVPRALESSRHLLVRPGVLVLISDFYCEPEALREALNPYLHRGCRVVLVQVSDPAELELPGQGLSRYVDMETGERLTFRPELLRKAYAERVREHRAALHAMAESRGMLFLSAQTDQSVFPLLDALSS